MTSLEESPSPLLEGVLQPVPGGSAAGEDASYDDDFLWLKAEVDRISSVDAAGVDFGMIVEKSRVVLGQRSKDVRVASYLGFGLFQIEGFAGLYEGLAACLLLMERYWAEMYPPLRRMPARRNALQFLAERLADGVQRRDPVVDDRQPIEEALDVLKRLQEFTMGAMEDQAPLLSGLRSALDDALRRTPAPPAVVVPQAASAASDGETGAGAVSTSGPAGPPTSEEEALIAVAQAAEFLRARDASGAVSYKLSRSLLWGMVEEKPTNDRGMTPFRAPEEHRRLYLRTLAGSQEWAALLDEAEALFLEPPYHFWLDLQRFLHQALEGLGHAAACSAVAFETAAFVGRISGIEHLKFDDGTPFADPATRAWLDTLAVSADGEARRSAGGGEGGAEALLEGPLAEAQVELAQNNLAGALARLQAPDVSTASAKVRFRARLHMAELCLQSDQPALALPVLEELAAQAGHIALSEWEPALAVDVWAKLYQCCARMAEEPTRPEMEALRLHQRGVEAFEQVCRLDLGQALLLRGE